MSAEKFRKILATLPSTPERIPAFFFAHGSPALLMPKTTDEPLRAYQGQGGPLWTFLKEFGPALLNKYRPKGIVVFSAHWETAGERLVTDYGDENPLLYDYYNFPKELYEIKFKSRGDTDLASRVVELYHKAGLKARTTKVSEARGADGRGFEGPGLDHGVFLPFRIMFGEKLDIPVVEVSIDSSLDPEKNWQAGKAVEELRNEGILVLAGGLTAHNLMDRTSFSPSTAKELHRAFDREVFRAVERESGGRKAAMFGLLEHEGLRAMHPRTEHLVPLYVAGGAGEDGRVVTLVDLYGLASFAFV